MPKRKYFYTKKYRDLGQHLDISSSSSLSSPDDNEIYTHNRLHYNNNQENQLSNNVWFAESEDELASGFQFQKDIQPAQILSSSSTLSCGSRNIR